MCDVVTALAATSFIVDTAGKITQHRGQQQQADKTRAAADASAREGISQISLRQNQEQDAAAQSILQADRQARMADAQARVSAGEAGVAGASVDAVLHDISQQDAEFRSATNTNLSNTMDQLDAEKRGIRVQAANQKSLVPYPTPLATGLSIAGSGLDMASLLIRRKTKSQS